MIEMNLQQAKSLKVRDIEPSIHLADQMKKRGISPQEVLDCIEKGRLTRGTSSNIGETVRFCHGTLVVVVGKHPIRNTPVLVTVFHDDRLTGLTGGMAPTKH